ncbi:MAG: TIGR03643 family protein [Rhizobacter sp.]|nr:TIGR03643 family protein [Burkholderiales bacterium]
MKTVAATHLSEGDVSRIVEMAWEDRTPFEAIQTQFGLNESAVIELMRAHMKASSFKMWRERMKGRVTKHAALRSEDMNDGGRHVARHRIPQR